MESFLRKYQWAVRLGFIAAGVTLVAVIVNHVVAGQLATRTVPKLPGFQVESNQRPTPADTSGPKASTWDDRLVSRCLFGCPDESSEEPTCPDGCDEGESCQNGVCVPDEPQKPERDSDVPVESDLKVQVMGCMVADNPEYSLAMIQTPTSSQTFIVGVGDLIQGNAEIVRITRDRIFIRREGRLEYIQLDKSIGGDPSPVSIGGSGGPGPTTPNSISPKRNATGQPSSLADKMGRRGPNSEQGSGDQNQQKQRDNARGDDSGNAGSVVRESSGNNYVLEEDKLDKKLGNAEELVNEVRIIPNFDEQGERSGVKVVGVSPSGLYNKLGFETGDVLHSVNGRTVENQSDAKQLIDGMKGTDSFSVVIERDGEKIEKNYEIE